MGDRMLTMADLSEVRAERKELERGLGHDLRGQEARPFGHDESPAGVPDLERRSDDGRVRLVWIGSAATLKYLGGIQPVLEDLAGRFDNLILRMISDEYLDMASMKTERCPWSGETEAANLMTSDIGLAPLPDDPFTRGKCGFKILQYQAAGLPVVPVSSLAAVAQASIVMAAANRIARIVRGWGFMV